GEVSSKKLPIEGVIFVIFTPLYIVTDTKEMRFPIFVGLKTLNESYENFNKREERSFWSSLLESIEDALISTEDEIKILQTEHHLTIPKVPLLKSPMHFEAIKHGNKPDKQLKLPFSRDQTELEEEIPSIEVAGLNLNKKHYHALNAIQILLNETNHEGNALGEVLDGNNTFKFKGYLPRIKFSRSDYLSAYGVKKNKTKRGYNEFSGLGSDEALGALKDLATINHLIIRRRTRIDKREKVIDRIQTVSPILKICEGWENLTTKEDKKLSDGVETTAIKEKHSGFLIEPCPLLVDDVNSYFVLKPANMYEELKVKAPKASRYTYAFIDLIIKTATLAKPNTKEKKWPTKIEFSRETLSYKLKLHTLMTNSNWVRIDQIIANCIKVAKDIGWIVNHKEIKGKTVEKKDIFYLNMPKFENINCKSIKTDG
ncbi:hypothetical protein N9Y92_04610, partial [Chlamydiales bacterium]|nr:hypothetical protein [Chlamydiales bacterium]